MKRYAIFLFWALTAVGAQNAPNWSVNPADYQFTSNLTAVVEVDHELAADSAGILGVFSGDTCRGVATPTNVLGTWMYFLTAYSNVTQENLSMRVYVSGTDTIADVRDSLIFLAGSSTGSPTNPDTLNAFLFYDHIPLVSGIPALTIETGSSFTSFDLDDYLTELDGETVTWSVSGETNLSAVIDGNNVVTVEPVNTGWIGTESLVFTVTDETPNAFSSSDTTDFTILPLDHPPVLNSVPDQTIGNGGSFASVNLNTYLSEQDDDSIGWSVGFNDPLSTDTIPGWSVNPANFVSSMTVTARVHSRGLLPNSNHYTLAAFVNGECRGVTTPVQALGEWMFFLTVYANNNGETVDFRFYDGSAEVNLPAMQTITFEANTSLGAPESPYEIIAGFLNVTVSSNGTVQLTAIDPTWSGSESVRFMVTDLGTLNDYSDTTSAFFTILPDHTPIVTGIANQTVEEGSSFTSFDLDDYLTELDGETVTWSVSGETNLSAVIDGNNVVTVEPVNTGWIGTESLVFTVTDETPNAFSSSDTTDFTILPLDHPPVLGSIPGDTVGIGGEFNPISLNDYLTEIDGQTVQWSYAIAPADTPQTAPNWSVNPTDFEFNMNLTARITLRGAVSDSNANVLAAFYGDECRGVTPPIAVPGGYAYFLTISGNTNGDPITFKIYDALRGDVVTVRDTLSFVSNDVIGEPNDPYPMDASRLNLTIDSNAVAQPVWIGAEDYGTERVFFIASDVGTEHGYADTTLTLFTVLPQVSPVVADIPAQIIDEGGSFTGFDLDTYLSYSGPVNWSYSGNQELVVNINAENGVTITPPDTNWNGSETIRFTATDAANAQLSGWTETVFTVNPVNDAPQITSTPITTALEDSPYNYTVRAYDVDGNSLIVSTNPLPGWLSFDGDSVMSGTPTNDDVGFYTIALSVSDQIAAPVTQQFSLEVKNTNDPPQVVIPIPDKTVLSGAFSYVVVRNIIPYFFDPDVGDHLAYSAIALSSGLDSLAVMTTGDSAKLVAYPDSGFDGEVNLAVRATDDSMAFAEDTLLFTITQSNRPPAFTSDPLISVLQDQEYRYVPKASDPDGNPLTFSADSLPGWLSFSGDSVLIGTPTNDDVGDHVAQISVTDGMAEPVQQSFTITVVNVNDRPVAVTGNDITTIAGTTVELNGSQSYDIDDDELIYTWSSPDSLPIADPLQAQAYFTAPDVDEPTQFTIVLFVYDGILFSLPDSVHITVDPQADLGITDFSQEPQDTGTPLTISITFPDYFAVEEATLFYLSGGESVYHSVTMSPMGRSQVYSAAIPAGDVSESGVAHYISAVDTLGQILTTDVQSVPVNVAAETYSMSNANSAYANGIESGKWRIISIPTLVTDRSLETLVTQALGKSHGEHTWQVYDWDGENWMFPDSLLPGHGYWMNHQLSENVNLTAGAGVSVDLSGYTLTLHSGWNLFSSPYPFPVMLHADSMTFSGPYAYDDFNGEGWGMNVDTLKPWGGYALYNWTDQDQDLILSPIPGSNRSNRKIAQTPDGWRLNLGISANGFSDNRNMIGQANIASDKRDGYDKIEPPYQQQYVSLWISDESIHEKVTSFAADIRSFDQGVNLWKVKLASNQMTGRFTVRTEFIGQLPDGYSVIWLDPADKSTIDLTSGNRNPEVTVRTDFVSTYQVLAGPAVLVQNRVQEIMASLPDRFALDQNYPNPFNGNTMIRYTLDSPAKVTLRIINIRGQRVKILVNKTQDLGHFTVNWDGTNARNLSVSSGMYFYQVQIMPLNGNKPMTQTRKMVFLQ